MGVGQEQAGKIFVSATGRMFDQPTIFFKTVCTSNVFYSVDPSISSVYIKIISERRSAIYLVSGLTA